MAEHASTLHKHASTPTPDAHAQAVAALLAPLLARLADPASAEQIAVGAALGRVLAVPVASPIAVPPFANSQMDGYAVRAADVAGAEASTPVRMPVGRTSAAGDAPPTHVAGTASPVMTGAPIPLGADAVIPIEQADPPRFPDLGEGRPHAAADATVAFAASVAPGTFVRDVGADLAAGAQILAADTRLGPAQLGSLAAAGITGVAVRPRPRVLLISTGQELRSPGEPLAPGQIYDANTVSLTAALREAGAEPIALSAPDEAAALLDAVARHPDVDLIVTTGGVSAGAFEVVRDALEPAGVRFGHVAMQPGGPQGLGIAHLGARAVPVVAFPGNPVSALLSFEMFLRPALRAASVLSPRRATARAPLAHPIVSPAAKHQVRRGTLRADGTVEVGAPGSHLLHDYARATVLVHVPIGVDALPAGADVEIWRIDD